MIGHGGTLKSSSMAFEEKKKTKNKISYDYEPSSIVSLSQATKLVSDVSPGYIIQEECGPSRSHSIASDTSIVSETDVRPTVKKEGADKLKSQKSM